jgi:hypothetical protein
MGAVGKDYGSERHLLSYRKSKPEELDQAILTALKQTGATIEWLYPDGSGNRGAEFTGVSFLEVSPWAKGTARAQAAWKEFWPQGGRAQCWDGVAILHVDEAPQGWLLFEAKSNHPEFVGARTKATPKSLETIEKALNRTKKEFGVHRFFDWTASYYQFANRLAATTFLSRHAVPTTLVEVFFTGDRFPDGTACPASADAWRTLVEARRLTLGLTPDATHDHVVDVFLPAFTH